MNNEVVFFEEVLLGFSVPVPQFLEKDRFARLQGIQ